MSAAPRLPSYRRSASLAVFIKATMHDLQPFLFLQDDLRQFCRTAGPVIISVPDAHVAAFRGHVVPGYEIISDSAVARAANVPWPIRDNWYTQQLLKLCASDVITADAYLVLDSNTIINAEFDESTFQVNDRWVYEIADANERDLDWERRTWTFLQLQPSRTLGFRTVNQVFARQELMGLRQYLERIYRAPWGDTLYASCECATRLGSALWTEFQMYGAYVAMISSTRTHALATKNPLMYFNPRRHLGRLPDVLSWFAEHRPFMVKAHRQRPGIRLSQRDYAGVSAAIRTACRGGGVSVGRVRARQRETKLA
jgi:uncharacterized protein DUF6492